MQCTDYCCVLSMYIISIECKTSFVFWSQFYPSCLFAGCFQKTLHPKLIAHITGTCRVIISLIVSTDPLMPSSKACTLACPSLSGGIDPCTIGADTELGNINGTQSTAHVVAQGCWRSLYSNWFSHSRVFEGWWLCPHHTPHRSAQSWLQLLAMLLWSAIFLSARNCWSTRLKLSNRLAGYCCSCKFVDWTNSATSDRHC